jgi:hypothetical protein
MTDFQQTSDDQLIELDPLVERRNERREFFRTALGAGAVAAAGAAAIAVSTGALAAATTETDYLNIALNLEYLAAQYYAFAVTGAGLPTTLLTPGSDNTTTQGAATGGGPVPFADPLVSQYAREIYAEKVAHVTYLRATLGTVAVAQPVIDLSNSTTSAFTIFGRAAGIATNSAGTVDSTAGTFNPYASDANFLLGAFLFEDLIVSAYRGLISLFTTKTYIDGLAGIIGASSYHASIIRTVLYTKGATTASLRTQADAISDTRDKLDGTVEDDQGISPVTITTSQSSALNTLVGSNIVPTGADGIVFGRSYANVLNVLYLNSLSVSKGGFFPNGLNGTYATSAAN